MTNALPVHPRVCGEHWCARPRGVSTYGSSPRVRGTHALRLGLCRRSRFIPACAGNTKSSRPMAIMAAVHPRVCGEHVATILHFLFSPGSSPRVRGTPLRHLLNALRRRFIPACAGNTLRLKPTRRARAVHPRVCGEHDRTEGDPTSPGGSSPRVRGTHAVTEADLYGGRFIPACAGNTPSAIAI